MVINATGLWSVSDYGSTPNFCSGIKGELQVHKKDAAILKRLASEVREISLRPVELDKKKLWTAHNMLKTKEPVIFCDPENGWNELVTEGMLQCSSNIGRRWEMVLRKEIYWADNIKDDKVIEPNFDIGYTYSDNNWGLYTKIHGGHGGSYVWDAPVKDLKDVDKIELIKINIDYDTTRKTFELAKDIFGNLLNVRLTGKWWWSLGLTIDLVFLRGLEKILWDMTDNKKLLKKLMQILKEGTQRKLDYLEENELLSSNVDKYVGSGGFGYTEELSGARKKNSAVKTMEMWGFGESQETSNVSPGMFEEFVFQYQLPILSRFGLNCYGCCEPLQSRWQIIKQIPNLRRVSVSPWADVEKMADNLQDNYIFSLKPNPADLAVSSIDRDYIRKKIRKVLEITKGCILEIIMKDNHTLGKNPGNLSGWVNIVKEEAGK